MKKNNKKFEGVIYKRTLIAPESKETGDYGKSYIGQTDNMAERDINWHKPNNKNYGGKKITEARIKYGVGEDAWETEILETVTANSKEELYEKLHASESEHIKQNDSVENGFNGSYGDGMKGMKHTDESKAKISANHRHYQAEETKKKISKSNTGRVVSQQTREKISAGNSGKKLTNEHRRKLSESRKGKEPVAASKGLQEYIKKHGHGPTKGKKQSDAARANMKAAQQKRGTKVKAIYPDGSTKNFPTMSDAAKAFDMKVGSIDYAIKTKRICKKGMRFEKA